MTTIRKVTTKAAKVAIAKAEERIILPLISKAALAGMQVIAKTVLADGSRYVLDYPYVQNPHAEFMCNLRASGDVKITVPLSKKSVTVILSDFWPNWIRNSDTGLRQFEKHGYRGHLQMLAAGTLPGDNLQYLLEVMAYCALMVLKARERTPHEGNICAHFLTLAEASGWKVESARMGDVVYGRDTIESKSARLDRYVQDGIANGMYAKVRGKRATIPSDATFGI
jgi:hypothetical protein